MSIESKSFYEKLVPFSLFSEVANPEHYRELPSDWWVVVTDIAGSTKAIEENRYKDVNLLGASSIVAVLNRLKGKEVPFVFGGDGATILVHADDMETIRPSLIRAQRLARDVFAMELRTGAVPVSVINGLGASVEVAKFAISEKSTIAAIRGGGLQVAEKLVKDPSTDGQKFRIAGDLSASEADFEGLSCRWNPIKAKKGEMMSLLILAKESKTSSTVYRETLRYLESVLDSKDSRPVAPEKMDRGLNYRSLLTEMRIQAFGFSFFTQLGKLKSILVEALVMRILVWTGAAIKGWFTADRYLQDLSANTDFQKFDDMIRMVRDCSREQKNLVLNYLEEQRANGRLYYGAHFSNEALMTCLVFQLDNHIHFVDGGGGGYALAAKQLKAQIKES